MKLVSCIMPTRGRRDWALEAVQSFQLQTYPMRELLILDDETEPSFPEGIDSIRLPGIEKECIWHRIATSRSIPAKRNECCRGAHGEIIIHWDSDDWNAPDRIADQVQRLEESGKAVTGYSSMIFYDPSLKQFGRFVGDSFYALGTSLCYLKSWWQVHPFNEALNIGEDNAFGNEANRAQQLAVSADYSKIVARVHSGNTSPKDIGNYRAVEPSMIPAGFPV